MTRWLQRFVIHVWCGYLTISTLLFTSTDIPSLASGQSPAVFCPLSGQYYERNDVCIFLVLKKVVGFDARHVCKSSLRATRYAGFPVDGLDLISIPDQETNHFVCNTIFANVNKTTHTYWWIGIYYASDGHYKWHSNDQLAAYTNWRPGRPHYYDGHGYVEKMATFSLGYAPDCTWAEHTLYSDAKGVICQIRDFAKTNFTVAPTKVAPTSTSTGPITTAENDNDDTESSDDDERNLTTLLLIALILMVLVTFVSCTVMWMLACAAYKRKKDERYSQSGTLTQSKTESNEENSEESVSTGSSSGSGAGDEDEDLEPEAGGQNSNTESEVASMNTKQSSHDQLETKRASDARSN